MSEPIAARATGGGGAGFAMIRVSGDGAVEHVASLSGGTLSVHAGGQTVVGGSIDLGSSCWPARFSVFRAPRSYTAEDVVEITVPGAVPAVAAVLDALFARGVRAAEPGEFTRRACVAGRIDLTRAEGIQALVRARDDAARRAALDLTGGAVSSRVAAIRDGLIDLLADLEASLDFLEHEVDPAEFAGVDARLEAMRVALSDLVGAAEARQRVDGAPRIVLYGRANAGKSTLFNAVLGRDRARVAPGAGTTRDLLGARIVVDGTAVVLFDAPGVDGMGSVGDRAAVETGNRIGRDADLCTVVADAHDDRPPPAPCVTPCVLVVSKVDLDRRVDLGRWRSAHRPIATIETCAPRGVGVESLRDAWAAWVARVSGEDPAVAAGSVRASVRTADRAVSAAVDGRRAGEGAELTTVHLREAADALGAITGRIDDESVLDVVFSRFCIGK